MGFWFWCEFWIWCLVLVAIGCGGGRVSWDEDLRLCGMLLVVSFVVVVVSLKEVSEEDWGLETRIWLCCCNLVKCPSDYFASLSDYCSMEELVLSTMTLSLTLVSLLISC
ncbi:hypothetical protein Droror1_Dr00023974, partial [Drosera rotundifolia]